MSENAKNLVITRTFDAPRDFVFELWSEKEHLERWWGPKGTSLNVLELEFRPGGRFHYRIDPPQGDPMYGLFTYQDIDKPESFSFRSGFSDAEGNYTRHSMAPEFPLQVLTKIHLAEEGEKTVLTLTGGPAEGTPENERAFYEGIIPNMQGGFAGTFDALDELIASLKKTK